MKTRNFALSRVIIRIRMILKSNNLGRNLQRVSDRDSPQMILS